MIRLRSILRIIAMLSATILVIAMAVDASPHPLSSVQVRGPRDGHDSQREKRAPAALRELSVPMLQSDLAEIGKLSGGNRRLVNRKILIKALSQISRWAAAVEHAYSHAKKIKASEDAAARALESLSRTKYVYLIPGWEGTEPVDGLSPMENLARTLDDAFNSVFLRYTGKPSIEGFDQLRVRLQGLLGPDLYDELALTDLGANMPYYSIFHGMLWIDAQRNNIIPPGRSGYGLELGGKLREGVIQGLDAVTCAFHMGLRTSPNKDRILDACKTILKDLDQVPMGPLDCTMTGKAPARSRASDSAIVQEHATTAVDLPNELDTQDDIAIPKGKKPKTNHMDIGFLLNPIEEPPVGPQVQVAPVEVRLDRESSQRRPTEDLYPQRLNRLRSLLKRVPGYFDTTHQVEDRDRPTPSQNDYSALLAEILWWRAALTQREAYIKTRVIGELLAVAAESLGDDLQPLPERPMREQAIVALDTLKYRIFLIVKTYEQDSEPPIPYPARSTPRRRKRPLPGSPFQG